MKNRFSVYFLFCNDDFRARKPSRRPPRQHQGAGISHGPPRDTGGTRGCHAAGIRRPPSRPRSNPESYYHQCTEGTRPDRISLTQCVISIAHGGDADGGGVDPHWRRLTRHGPIGVPRMSMSHASTLVMPGRPPGELTDPEIIFTKRK